MRTRSANALLNLFAFSLLSFALYLNFLKKDDQGFFQERTFTASVKEAKNNINMPAAQQAEVSKRVEQQ